VATRRRYRTPQRFRDGGAVLPLDDIVAHTADGAPAAPAPGPSIDPAPSDDAAVLHALHATQRAEELHREAATKAPHEAFVDSMRGLSGRKRDFLKANAALLRQDIAPIAGAHYQAGLASGLPDDSPELERFILEKTAEDLEQRRKLAAGSARWRADDEALSQAALALDREAEAFARDERADRAREMEDEIEVPERAPISAPAARRSSVQVSAPVSRDSHSYSSGRAASIGKSVTLSPAEREIARTAYSAPDMTDEMREKAYAMAKMRMLRMRADGTLNE
jgi:hypothetical protein